MRWRKVGDDENPEHMEKVLVSQFVENRCFIAIGFYDNSKKFFFEIGRQFPVNPSYWCSFEFPPEIYDLNYKDVELMY